MGSSTSLGAPPDQHLQRQQDEHREAQFRVRSGAAATRAAVRVHDRRVSPPAEAASSMALRAVARFPCLSAPTDSWHRATLIYSASAGQVKPKQGR